jgi:hypothetical protein
MAVGVKTPTFFRAMIWYLLRPNYSKIGSTPFFRDRVERYVLRLYSLKITKSSGAILDATGAFA